MTEGISNRAHLLAGLEVLELGDAEDDGPLRRDHWISCWSL
jgi:hypothetical protein